MAEGTRSSELRSTWEAAAPGWANWERTFSDGLSGATEALLDMAGVSRGMCVLDLACGAGSQSLQAAKRVGPEGRVVACDISATMLEHVRRNAASAGLGNVETLECAAEDLAAELAVFDAAICRLGLMLFAAPGDALTRLGRVLRPRARMAALVFTTAANNPFMAQPSLSFSSVPAPSRTEPRTVAYRPRQPSPRRSWRRRVSRQAPCRAASPPRRRAASTRRGRPRPSAPARPPLWCRPGWSR